MRIVVLLLLGFITSLPVVTIAQQTTRRICDTIHYELIREKIIIPVTVNGIKVKYNVETGGKKGTMRDEDVDMKATSTGTSTSVSDINREGTRFHTGLLNGVELSPNSRLHS